MSWISGLSFDNLQRLREVVRKVHFQHMPTPFDVKEADKMIEEIGQETAERLLKAHIEEKLK